MGQQQLLLLILGVIVVGLAVIVGIYAFSRNQIKANADAMVVDALRIASDIQTWSIKPGMAGGRLDNETIDDHMLGVGHGFIGTENSRKRANSAAVSRLNSIIVLIIFFFSRFSEGNLFF